MSIGTAYDRWDPSELEERPPVILACGPEETLKDELLERLAERFPSSDREILTLQADEIEPSGLLQEIRSRGLFSGEKWVVLKRLHQKAGGHPHLNRFLDDVLEYLENPEENTLLILEDRDHPYRKGRKLGKLARAVESAGGQALVFWEPFEHRVRSTVKEMLEDAGLSVDPAALQLLLKKTEGKYAAARREARKLIDALEERVQVGDVEELVSREEASDAYGTLKERLLTEEPSASLQILRDLWREGKPPVQVFHVIAGYLRELRELKHTLNRTSSMEEALEIVVDRRVSKSNRKTYQQNVRILKSRFPEDFHRRVYETEKAAKYRSGTTMRRLAVERFVIDVVPSLRNR